MVYPWQVLSSWMPFHIDALGLVTLLGAEEVDASLGRLAPSRWLECMPLLAGFVFASDQFRSKQPSFLLYNISSGIVTSDLASWFTRWMKAQEFEITRSLAYWEMAKEPRRWWPYYLFSGVISFFLTGFLVALAVLSDDWYGFANAVAIIVLTAVRSFLLQANRSAIDRAVQSATPLRGTFRHAAQEWEEKHKNDCNALQPREDTKLDAGKWKPEQAKFLVIMPDSRVVTMFIPEQLLISVFVRNPTLHTHWLYHLIRWTGWVAFAVHVVAIGMSQLPTQIYVVAIMVIPTVLVCFGFGCDDSKLYKWWQRLSDKDSSHSYVFWIGSYLKATVFEWPKDVEFERDHQGKFQRIQSSATISREQRSTKRQDLYAWLNLTPEEEASLSTWQLLPHPRNHDRTWREDFEEKKHLIQRDPPDIPKIKGMILDGLERKRGGTKTYALVSLPKDDVERADAKGLPFE
jgi:hypothetical protein